MWTLRSKNLNFVYNIVRVYLLILDSIGTGTYTYTYIYIKEAFKVR
jgi:hypothetical protein